MRVISPAHLGVVVALLLALALPASAQEVPDHTVPVLPPLDESTPSAVTVPAACDPLELVLCVGPVSEDVPVVVAVSSEGVYLLLWMHEGESEAFGPVQETVIVPVTGTEVPITLCPSTCPVPVLPEGEAVASFAVCSTFGGSTECHTVGSEGGVVDELVQPCSETDTSSGYYLCTLDNGQYKVGTPVGTIII